MKNMAQALPEEMGYADLADEIVEEENFDDNAKLDALRLSPEKWRVGIIKCLLFTLVAVIIFFVPVTVGETTDVTFGIIYKGIKAALGLPGIWLGGLIIIGNGLLCIYGKFIAKK